MMVYHTKRGRSNQASEQTNGALVEVEAPFAAQRWCWMDDLGLEPGRQGVQQTAHFATQTDAKRFFVSRVIEQAHADGVSLSEAERHMLNWSESDPDFEPNFELAEAPEVSEPTFEPKVARLIRRAYDRECRLRDQAQLLYQDARAKLSEGDHYMSVMVAQALG